MKAISCIYLLITISATAIAQNNEPDVKQLLLQYKNEAADTNQLNTCLQLSSYYLFKGIHEDDVDTAFIFLKQAQQLSNRLHNENLQYKTMSLLGNYYILKGDVNRGKALCKKAIDYYHAKENVLQEAVSWSNFGKSMTDTNTVYLQEKLQCFQQAQLLFKQLHKQMEAAEILQQIADCHTKQNKLYIAENEMLQVLKIYRSLHYPRLLETYNRLAQISEAETDLHKELFYRLEIVKKMESTADTAQADYYYAKLALVYADLDMYPESLNYILKALDILKKRKQYDDYYGDLSLAIYDFISEDKPQLALDYLFKTAKEVPPQNLAHEVDLNEAFGNCYAAMKQYEKAEQYYLKMMKIFGTTKNSNLYSTHEQMIIDLTHYNQIMGNFYIGTHQYQKAGYYFNQILMLPAGSVRPITLTKIHLMQFKVDSASHNFISAINHYEIHKQIDDSLFNLSKNQQIQELNIKYETEKQSKDIVALTSQTKLQEANLKKASLVRNLIIISAMVLLALFYTGYRFKQRHNLKLQAQQQEINQQNNQLRELLTVQQKLVTEKEWLLKEIHHRVKNNLQIVISLLSTQSKYLDNEEAIEAIAESRHRMQAISLIHQKLYQSENTTSVNMQTYITELAEYLETSFNTGKQINFQTDIDAIELDLSQAIPIGLILNELITNAIKYAFEEREAGCISVNMHSKRDNEIVLEIKDNGKGMPADYDLKKSTSMGMRLIAGLVKQINGSLIFENKNGVCVQVTFIRDTKLTSISV